MFAVVIYLFIHLALWVVKTSKFTGFLMEKWVIKFLAFIMPVGGPGENVISRKGGGGNGIGWTGGEVLCCENSLPIEASAALSEIHSFFSKLDPRG